MERTFTVKIHIIEKSDSDRGRDRSLSFSPNRAKVLYACSLFTSTVCHAVIRQWYNIKATTIEEAVIFARNEYVQQMSIDSSCGRDQVQSPVGSTMSSPVVARPNSSLIFNVDDKYYAVEEHHTGEPTVKEVTIQLIEKEVTIQSAESPIKLRRPEPVR